MLKYSLFLENKALSIINESLVFYSPILRSRLSQLNTNISNDLLSIEGTDVKPDVSFINLDKDGYLSFITMKNASKMISDRYPSIPDFGKSGDISTADTIWSMESEYNTLNIYKKSRNLIKIGRLINTLFPEKYTDKEIEQFVNEFKALHENSKEKISVVEGDKIDFWYDSKNYEKLSGALGNSCMRSKKGIFEIYTKNPEVCKLVILTENGKLKGRALLWKISKNSRSSFEYFMDRQYTIYDSDINKFKKYANDEGWAYKTYNNHNSINSATYKDTVFSVIDMNVDVNPVDYINYPYMDTFKIYDPKTGTLYNDNDKSDIKNSGRYILENTDGGYQEIEIESEDEESGNWSDYYGENIPESESIYSHPLSDYIYTESSVSVDHGARRHRGRWPEDHDDIVFSNRNEEYYHIDDAVFSDYYNSQILYDDSVSVVKYIDTDGDCNTSDYYLESGDNAYVPYGDLDDMDWFNKFKESNYNHWVNHVGIMENILIINYQHKWIPKDFSIKVYQIDGSDGYLSKIDAYILNTKILNTPFIMDKIEYNTNFLVKLYPKLIRNCKKLVDKNQLELDLNIGDKDKIENRYNEVRQRLIDLESKEFIL